ncbi:MAG: tetratricopeptide repeat protein [Synechococcus sp.]
MSEQNAMSPKDLDIPENLKTSETLGTYSQAHPSSKKQSRLAAAEWAAIVASFGGSIAAALMQQVALAAIPLSVTATLSLCHRKQQLDSQTQRIESQEAIISMQTKLLEQFQSKQDRQMAAIASQVQESDKQLNNLQSVALNLRTVQNCTQQILNDPPTSSSYYLRAMGHHRLGDLEEAILDYSEAIARDPKNAKAYFNRGKANAKLGNKQEAVEDMRNAAKVFFEEGNIESYSKAKELSSNLHQLEQQQSPESFDDDIQSPELVVMEGLFT